MRSVLFTADAVRQYKRLPKALRPSIKDAVRAHLVEADPLETTRSKFRLRRASEHADFELRAGSWRVFYRVEADRVLVTLIGEKRGESLFVEGKEVRL